MLVVTGHSLHCVQAAQDAFMASSHAQEQELHAQIAALQAEVGHLEDQAALVQAAAAVRAEDLAAQVCWRCLSSDFVQAP